MKLLKEDKKVNRKGEDREDSVTLEAVDQAEVATVENLSAFCDNLGKNQVTAPVTNDDKTFELTSDAMITAPMASP